MKRISTKKLPNPTQVNVNKELMAQSKGELVKQILELREKVWRQPEWERKQQTARTAEIKYLEQMQKLISTILQHSLVEVRIIVEDGYGEVSDQLQIQMNSLRRVL